MQRDPSFPVHDIDTEDVAFDFSFSVHVFSPKDGRQQAGYPHRHSFYQVIFLTGGVGTHVVDMHAMPITPPVLFFVSPGQVHSWQLRTPLAGYSVLFSQGSLVPNASNPTAIDKLALFHSLAYSPLRLQQEQATALSQLIELMRQEYREREFNYQPVVSAYLHVFLGHLERYCTAANPEIPFSSKTELVRQFKHMVSMHFIAHRSIEFYADQLGVSAAHLSKTVKEVTGFTAGHIIHQELGMEAKRLLFNTTLTVEQISDRLAFNDPSYFGRYFKRVTGSSPGEYRKVSLEKYQTKHI